MCVSTFSMFDQARGSHPRHGADLLADPLTFGLPEALFGTGSSSRWKITR
jgi:hypothetical protein